MPNPTHTTTVSKPLTADEGFKEYLSAYPADFFISRGLADPYIHSNLTIRLEAASATNNVAGDVVQCGVYKGASLAPLALLVRALGTKKVWGCDTFSGFPNSSTHDLIEGELPAKAQPRYFADTSVVEVTARLKQLEVAETVTLVSGSFADALPMLPVSAISLLILDCDLYDSYRVVLETLYDRVTAGGIIIFDEYFSPKYPGARRAVDEFFANKKEKPERADAYLQYHSYERWFVRK